MGTVGELAPEYWTRGGGFQSVLDIDNRRERHGVACTLCESVSIQTQQLVQQDWGGGYTL